MQPDEHGCPNAMRVTGLTVTVIACFMGIAWQISVEK